MLQRLVEMLSGQSLDAGYAVVFGLLLLCGFGLPLPEDVILVTGGILAWLASPIDEVSFASMIRDDGLITMVLVGLAGILAGDSVIYLVGRRLGVHVAEHKFLRRIVTPEKLERVETLLRRRGKIVVVIARYLPGLRAPTYFTVGHSRLPYWEFLLFDGIAALLSAPLWVCIGFWFGADVHRAAVEASRFGRYLLIAIALVGVLLLARWIQRRSAARNASARVS